MRSSLLSVLAVLSVAGCAEDGVRTVSYPHPQTSSVARLYLQEAAARGPVLLEVRDNPFARDVARPMAEAASRTSVGFLAPFTADRGAAGPTDYRVVVQFDPAPGTPSAAVCDRDRAVGRAADPRQVTALVAFCHRNGPVLSLVAWGPRPDSADSLTIRRMTEQAMIRMFTPEPLDKETPIRFMLR